MGGDRDVKTTVGLKGRLQMVDTLLDTLLAACPDGDDRRQAELSWQRFASGISALNEPIQVVNKMMVEIKK